MAIATQVIAGCEKSNQVAIPPEIATFAARSSGSYYVQDDPSSVYKITVGATTKSNQDRTVTFNVSSPSGATEGVQYELASNTVTIPAGEVTATIDVKGIFSGFPGSRKDTLVFSLASGHLNPGEFNNTFSLYMQKYCDVDINMFDDVYDIQDYYQGQPDGDAYQVLVTPGTSSGTTGSVNITGLWAVNIPVKVDLDWTDPAGFSTSIAEQNFFVHPTYGQSKIKGIGKGTFSSCDNEIVITYEVYVDAGSFGVYTSVIKL